MSQTACLDGFRPEADRAVFYGWSLAGHPQLLADGKPVPVRWTTVARPDVADRFKKNPAALDSGFIGQAALPAGWKKLEVRAEQELLAAADSQQLAQEGWLCAVMEGVREMPSGFEAIGWCLQPDVQIEVLAGNEPVPFSLRRELRPDLIEKGLAAKEEIFCGFRVHYEKQSQPVSVRLFTEQGERRLKIPTPVPVSRSLHRINGALVRRGVQYLRQNGLKAFAKRLRQGPPHLSVYENWYLQHAATKEKLEAQRRTKFEKTPLISICTAAWNTRRSDLEELVASLQNQSYENWELCLADGSDTDQVQDWFETQSDPRLKYKRLESNEGLAGNLNHALEMAQGAYIGLLDHDDFLAPDCLYEVVSRVQEEDIACFYSDEDKYKEGTFSDPIFKPAWNPDLFASHNYITHFFCVRADIARQVGGFDPALDGAQDYDWFWRIIDTGITPVHIPRVLYHWRMSAGSTAENPESKLYAYEAGRKAIENHWKRTGVSATVSILPRPAWGLYRNTYQVKKQALVSIIIPNKDQAELLGPCVRSLLKQTAWPALEVIIVENGSKEEATWQLYDELKQDERVRVVVWDKPFNYSALNNYGVSFAKGEFLLFLNNDTEVLEPDALYELVSLAQARPEVGAVGAQLLYGDDTTQHAGIVLGFEGYAGPVYHRVPRQDFGYMMRNRISMDYSALTGACLLVRRSVYEKIGGFDESFAVACNDVDICLRIRQLGCLVVYNAFSLWRHYESVSRGYEDTFEKQARFDAEVARFQQRWDEELREGDPAYSPNFALHLGPFAY